MADEDEFREGCPDCGRDSVVLIKDEFGNINQCYWADCGWWEPIESDEDEDEE